MEALEPTSSHELPCWSSPDGSFTKTILEPGSGVDKPKESSLCQIFLDPLAPDSGQPPSPSDFRYPTGRWFEAELGEGETVQDALADQCLETMLSGEACRVDTTTGSRFLLRMASFGPGKEAWELDTEERLRKAARDRGEGGKAYREGNMGAAERRYCRALRLLVCAPGEAKAERVTLLANMAACDLKRGRLREAEGRCTRALEGEPGHLKALYRRGVSRAGMGDWEGARRDLGEVLRLDPGNAEARREAGRVREEEREEVSRNRKAWEKMFR
ncbi:hypothetical protein FKM82_028652 [Ascaphus truei]